MPYAVALLLLASCSHTVVSRRAEGEPSNSMVVLEVGRGVRASVEMGPCLEDGGLPPPAAGDGPEGDPTEPLPEP